MREAVNALRQQRIFFDAGQQAGVQRRAHAKGPDTQVVERDAQFGG